MKLLLLFSALFFSFLSSAQVTTIFQCDFSNPSSYALSNVGGGDWVVTSSAPQGANSVYMGAMNSSTPSEYALFDSDYLGTGSQDGSITMTDMIDATGFMYVSVCFESYYKQGSGDCLLEVSTNGGASWTAYEVHDYLILPFGDSTTNPSSELVDISAAVASNPSTITLRFQYFGVTPGFAWMIDNVCVMVSNSPTIGLNSPSGDASLLIHPNPTNGVFSVDLSKVSEASEIRVTDLQGRLLLSRELTPTMELVELELVEAPGTYFVTVTHSEGEIRSTLVKK